MVEKEQSLLHISLHTECQKKLITSLERHCLKPTTSKSIIIIRTYISYWQYPLSSISEKQQQQMFAYVKKEKMQWNGKSKFFKYHRHNSRLEFGVRPRKKPVRWLHTPPLKLKEYLIFWEGGPLLRFLVRSFCDFWKITFCNFTAFFTFSTQANYFFFRRA